MLKFTKVTKRNFLFKFFVCFAGIGLAGGVEYFIESTVLPAPLPMKIAIVLLTAFVFFKVKGP